MVEAQQRADDGPRRLRGGLLGRGNLPSSLPVGVARRRRLLGRELHAALQRLLQRRQRWRM